MDRNRERAHDDYQPARPAHEAGGRMGGSSSYRTYADLPAPAGARRPYGPSGGGPSHIETAKLGSNSLNEAIASIGGWKPSADDTDFGPLFVLATALDDSRQFGHDSSLQLKGEAVLSSLLREMWSACRADLKRVHSHLGWDADQQMLRGFAERTELWHSIFTSLELRPYAHHPSITQAMTLIRGTERALRQAIV